MLAADTVAARSGLTVISNTALTLEAGISDNLPPSWRGNVRNPQGNRGRLYLQAVFKFAKISVTAAQLDTLMERLKYAGSQNENYQARFEINAVLDRILTTDDQDLWQIRLPENDPYLVPNDDPFANRFTSQKSELRLQKNKAKRAFIIMFSALVTVLMAGYFIWSFSNLSKGSQYTDESDLLTQVAAAQKLEALWQQGFAASLTGENTAYVSAMEQAVTLAGNQFGTDSLQYARSQNAMIGAFGSVNRLADAAHSAQEAVRVYSMHVGHEMDVALNKVNLAGKLVGLNLLESAEHEIDEALEIYESLPDTHRRALSLAGAHESLSQIFRSRGDYIQALEHAYKAVSLHDSVGENNTINYGWALANVAWIERHAGNCLSAQALFNQAVEVFDAAGAGENFQDRVVAAREAKQDC